MDIKVNENTVIVFDLDDTLYNELDFLKSAYRSIALFLEPKDWKQLYSRMFSLYRSKINVFEFLISRYEVSKESLISMYQNHYPDIQLFNGVIEVLEAIKSNKGRIGVVTDGRVITQSSKLKSLDILKYIDKIIISEEFGSEKPNVENFKAIEACLSGLEYYYIADNLKKDFIGPHFLGWTCIAVVDNGKNIHHDSYKYMDLLELPINFIVDFSDLKII
ncbi:HAD family hydrolase [uncultured Gelidibacter sp.]|uniref:HAD family hydrolase n=1 Tax=uncultured Gelidibacter sp. TaxID=259318 RepID=UPI002624197E|nr:HAD family hydrolase [uncultured Gelidibacter sp.]